MNDVLVKIRNLSKYFEEESTPALSNINAQISFGKIIGLVGSDGAGKTTLLRIMAGLLLPSEGNIEIAGFDTVKEAPEIHEIIGYMPQRFGLYEDLTVIQNLHLYADLQNLSDKDREKTFDKLLFFTGLHPFTTRLAYNLSGGMKQKLGLACTLLRKPKLLLLDEPSVGVDPISRRELWKMVSELRHGSTSIVWSTAYLDEAEKCDEVLLINEGKLLYSGPPDELTKRVLGRTFQIQNISTRRRNVLHNALMNENIIDGVIQGSAVRVVLKENATMPAIATLDAGEKAIWKEVPPRFEDAFMDILGGGPGGSSEIADITKSLHEGKETLVEAINLTKTFGNFVAAQDITFKIKRGEIFGLLGPNGAGKSTTFKMLCGLLTPTKGQSFVAGLAMQAAPSKARGRIGYMAQKFSLYSNMTCLQNLEFFSGIYSVPELIRKKTIDEMVKIFSLSSYLNTKASELPLGFKQRLALACTVMHNPEVLFLDEPTSGVDPITRREFWNHINGLVEKGVTVIITTHFMDEAESCDRIGLINHGELITIDSPDNLKEAVRSEKIPSPTLEDAFIAFSLERN